MAAPTRKSSRKPAQRARPAQRTRPAQRHGQRADFGKSIDSFFNKQPPHLRAILVELRAIVERTAPDAGSSIKWGMPFYQLGDNMFAALGAHKAHVNLILWGP